MGGLGPRAAAPPCRNATASTRLQLLRLSQDPGEQRKIRWRRALGVCGYVCLAMLRACYILCFPWIYKMLLPHHLILHFVPPFLSFYTSDGVWLTWLRCSAPFGSWLTRTLLQASSCEGPRATRNCRAAWLKHCGRTPPTRTPMPTRYQRREDLELEERTSSRENNLTAKEPIVLRRG